MSQDPLLERFARLEKERAASAMPAQSGSGRFLEGMLDDGGEADRSHYGRYVEPADLDQAMDVLAQARRGETVTGHARRFLEAIIEADRPVLLILGDQVVDPDELTASLLLDAGEAVRLAIRATGRIEGKDLAIPFAGTGFLIGPDHILTNRHVAGKFTDRTGMIRQPPSRAAWINFFREWNSEASEQVDIAEVVMVHPHWDAAILRLAAPVTGRAHLRLARTPATADTDVVVVGYPTYDSSHNDTLQRKVFDQKFGFKRLLPGKLRGRERWKKVDALTHDASTLGGNSGSPVVDPRSGCVVGLHFGGLFEESNFAVPSWELAADPRVAALGLFDFAAGTPTSTAPDAVALAWSLIEGGAVVPVPAGGGRESPEPEPAPLARLVPTARQAPAGDRLDLRPDLLLVHGAFGAQLRDVGPAGRMLWPAAPAAELLDPDVATEPGAVVDALYGRAIRSWRARGFVVHAPTFDWRRGAGETADVLHHAIAAIRIRRGGRPLVLIAHGTGGIAAAVYAHRYPSWRDAIEQAVLVGVPLGGWQVPAQIAAGTWPAIEKLGATGIAKPQLIEGFSRFPSLMELGPLDGGAALARWQRRARRLQSGLRTSPLLERATIVAGTAHATGTTQAIGDGAVTLDAARAGGTPVVEVAGEHFALLAVETTIAAITARFAPELADGNEAPDPGAEPAPAGELDVRTLLATAHAPRPRVFLE